MLKVLASKCMYNFPPHLSCDLALPGNTRTTEYACCIFFGCVKNVPLSEFILATSETSLIKTLTCKFFDTIYGVYLVCRYKF